jgi:predicted metal-dependent hydrolase
MSQLKKVGDKEVSIEGTLFLFEIYLSQRARKVRIEIRTDGNRIIIPSFAKNYSQVVSRIITDKKGWIIKSSARKKQPTKKFRKLPDKDKANYYGKAREMISGVVDKYCQKYGFEYNLISIRDQKNRWGSCSAKGNLSFNWRLIKLSPKLREYIVVHELVHLEHLNHSPEFWQRLESIYPEAKEQKDLLKKIPIC